MELYSIYLSSDSRSGGKKVGQSSYKFHTNISIAESASGVTSGGFGVQKAKADCNRALCVRYDQAADVFFPSLVIITVRPISI